MRSRAVITGLVAVAALAVLRVGVAPAESCPRVTADEAQTATDELEARAADDFYHDRPLEDATHVFDAGRDARH